MTDEQIVKALDCCHSELGNMCSICPLFDPDNDYCEDELHKNTLIIIKRQKAKIGRLQKENERWKNGFMGACMLENCKLKDEWKSEAIKEFAERLKNKIWYSDWCNFERTITPEIITTVVKEMTENK